MEFSVTGQLNELDLLLDHKRIESLSPVGEHESQFFRCRTTRLATPDSEAQQHRTTAGLTSLSLYISLLSFLPSADSRCYTWTHWNVINFLAEIYARSFAQYHVQYRLLVELNLAYNSLRRLFARRLASKWLFPSSTK